MPQIGNQKFPYTPAGIKRANEIKKKLMGPGSRRPTPTRPVDPSMIQSGPGRRPQMNQALAQLTSLGNDRMATDTGPRTRVGSTATDGGQMAADPSAGKGSDSVFNPPRGAAPERTPPSFGRPKPQKFAGRPFPRPSFPGRPGRPGGPSRPGNTWGLRPLPNKKRMM